MAEGSGQVTPNIEKGVPNGEGATLALKELPLSPASQCQ